VTYSCVLDVSRALAWFVAGLLGAERRRLGTRRATRALTPYHQARFALAWFRDDCDVERLGAGFGLSRATAYRYRDEAVRVLSNQAPDLQQALERAKDEELAYLILDGKIIESDRVAGTKISKKGKEIGVCTDVPAIGQHRHVLCIRPQDRQDQLARDSQIVLGAGEHIGDPPRQATERAAVPGRARLRPGGRPLEDPAAREDQPLANHRPRPSGPRSHPLRARPDQLILAEIT
jgi:hypothetical protein